MSTIYFTYLLRWSSLNVSYYGVRYGKKSHPSTLWTTYFTSSKLVKSFIEDNGQPDVIEIRKTFDCPTKALLWEQKVLIKLKVPFNEKWLNRNVGGHYNPVTKRRTVVTEKNNFKTNNPMKDPALREKMSNTRKEKGLGKQGAKYLTPLFGDKNPMRNPDILKLYKEKITGRRRKYKEDGTWSWSYEENAGELG